MRLFFSLLTVSGLSVLITYSAHRYLKISVKIPSIIFLILAIYNIISAKIGTNTGFEDLAKFLLAMFWAVASISSFIFGIILLKLKNNK